MTRQLNEHPEARLTRVLHGLGLPASTWYRKAKRKDGQRRRGPKSRPIRPELEAAVVKMATANPWYGYKRIAVMCRRAGFDVPNRQCYRVMKLHDLLCKPKPNDASVYQAAKLWELLPHGPNELWQTDVTYIHVPGFGWWYAITVIDYFSRYLLACRLTDSYSAAEAILALAEAQRRAEQLHGPLQRPPFIVTDNGPSFVAHRFRRFVASRFSHVRIAYRTPTQLGLLERFHRTLKQEEVYWRLYDSPSHARECLAEFQARYNELRPHWALIPEEGGDPVTPEDVYVRGQAVRIPKWQQWALKAKEQLDQMLEPDAA